MRKSPICGEESVTWRKKEKVNEQGERRERCRGREGLVEKERKETVDGNENFNEDPSPWMGGAIAKKKRKEEKPEKQFEFS